MKNSESSAGGYMVLFALVTLLATPLAIGHFVMEKAPAPTVHADATATN